MDMPFNEFGREEREALAEILRAAEAALSSGTDISEIVRAATDAMPVDASDFDRGLAAGFALARFLASNANAPDC
jgi:hypothetical protein